MKVTSHAPLWCYASHHHASSYIILGAHHATVLTSVSRGCSHIHNPRQVRRMRQEARHLITAIVVPLALALCAMFASDAASHDDTDDGSWWRGGSSQLLRRAVSRLLRWE